jgi:tight adherence protein C
MGFMIFSISVLVMLLTMVLFKNDVQKASYKKQQLRSMKEETRFLDEDLEKSFSQRLIAPLWKKIIMQFSKLANRSQRKTVKRKTNSKIFENQLQQAGISMQMNEYQLLKTLFTVIIIIAGFVTAFIVTKELLPRVLILLAVFIAVIGIPRFYIGSRIKSRRKEIQNQMPNVMDVLSVSIEAGLGFDAALLRVVEKLQGPLVDELNQVYREIQMGRSRRDALTALGKRNAVSELQMFSSAVVQSEQFGTPIKNVLKSQAQQLRISRRQQAQEKGMKAPIKMMLPMVIFIFPVIFIILLGPTLINIIGQFR